MVNSKIKKILNSFRTKLIIAISLIAAVSILLITKVFVKKDTTDGNNTVSEVVQDENKPSVPDLPRLKGSLEPGIDSVLGGFGIKKEWITTLHNTHSDKPAKNTVKDAEWFTKSVLIPKDLSSIEVNLDLSSYINSTGLSSTASEDIITKDIVITITGPDTAAKLPLAKISVTHSDKVTRESAAFSFIISGIGDYSPEEIDKLLMNKAEFSYVFPRNLDEIDVQSRLLQHKKDVLINLTIGNKDNYDTDFNSSMDEKAVRERVKSFSSDFPSVSSVILTKADADIPASFTELAAAELVKFNIKVITDQELTKLLTSAEDESADKTSILFTSLKAKAGLVKNIVTMVRLTPGEFERFYDNVLVLKKLGYKFYSYSEFRQKAAELEKQQKEKEEKLKQEEEKKLAEKRKQQELKKQQQKQEQKKQEKKTVTKKQPQTKTGDKKKTETKKK